MYVNSPINIVRAVIIWHRLPQLLAVQHFARMSGKIMQQLELMRS